MAVQAAGVVSKTLSVHIGLNNIYLRPTICKLDTLIVDAMGKDSCAIMEAEDIDADFLIEFLPIKKKGVKPCFFIVHDITGMATPFMPNEMYAIDDKHFGLEMGFGLIDAMAEHYISLIKGVQPEGPYVIGGYSYGGSVALCMAAKLVKHGDEVAHLILFDPIYIPSLEHQSLKSTDWTQCLINHTMSNFPDISKKWKNKLCVEIQKNLKLMFNYEADFYDGCTMLIVPKDSSWYHSGAASDFDTGTDDHNGWDAHIKNLDMKIAAGSHDTMFTPAHVKVLTGVVKDIIATIPDAGKVDTPLPKTKKVSKVKASGTGSSA
ncbi:Alpha/Beta hydrolase protein [Scleroderma citrinum]